jgi:ABC-type Fe3+ transport system substrate-binding protein
LEILMTQFDAEPPPPTRRNVLQVAAATATGLALPVGAGAPAFASGADDRQVDRHLRRLYRRALDEGGRLVIYAGGDSPTQEDATRQAFTAAFPGIDTTIRVDLSKYHAPRIDRQLALGELEPDVAQLQTLHDFSYWKRKGVLLPYKSPDFGHVRRAYKDPDGAFVGITVYSFGRVSNTSLLSDAEAPRDASEFLAPRFRDQLVFTYPNDDDAVLYAFYLVVKKYGLQYMEELMKQRPEFVRGAPAALGAVASGQKLASFAGFAPLLPIPGLPVRYSVPRTDAFMSWAQTAAIFKQARHPNAAKLYLTWQLTCERQTAAFQWPVRRDVAPPPGWGPITAYNTPINGFHRFMRDRAAVERFRGVIETFVGPVRGPSPLDT